MQTRRSRAAHLDGLRRRVPVSQRTGAKARRTAPSGRQHQAEEPSPRSRAPTLGLSRRHSPPVRPAEPVNIPVAVIGRTCREGMTRCALGDTRHLRTDRDPLLARMKTTSTATAWASPSLPRLWGAYPGASDPVLPNCVNNNTFAKNGDEVGQLSTVSRGS